MSAQDDQATTPATVSGQHPIRGGSVEDQKARIAARRAFVQDHYGRMPTPEIGEMWDCSPDLIRRDAVALGIAAQRAAPGVWNKPRGMTKEQKAWAAANPDHPEARMIRAMVAG